MVSFVENSAIIGSLASKKLGLILERRFILAPNVTWRHSNRTPQRRPNLVLTVIQSSQYLTER